jgi:hypothetical protein
VTEAEARKKYPFGARYIGWWIPVRDLLDRRPDDLPLDGPGDSILTRIRNGDWPERED